jgi:DMSO/TMAO reductase YedYZ heme-binding membrane subunit
MEAIYYTLAAVALYFVSDRILNWMEVAAKRRFEHRSLIFFAILLVLALASFALIRRFLSA